MSSEPERRFAGTALQLWSGLLVWAAYFLLVYVLGALACERGFADLRVAGFGVVPIVASIGLVASLAVTSMLVTRAQRRPHAEAGATRFVGFLTCALGLLGVVALAWTALPAMLLRTGCA